MRIGLNTSIVGGSLINPFAAYNIGGQTPQMLADFDADKYASANKNLGPELVTNGTFDTDITGWTSVRSGTLSFSSGAIRVENLGGNFGGIQQEISTEAGKVYEVSWTRVNSDTNSRLRIGSTSGASDISIVLYETLGDFSYLFVATGTSAFVQLDNSIITAGAFNVFDNVSVREVVSYSPASTTAADLLTHTRAGNAVQVADDGTLQWAGHNLLTYSEQFDNAAWQKVNAGVGSAPTVTANSGIAPDGTSTADRVQFNLNGGTTSGDVSRLRGSFTNPSTATGRFWVKSNDGNSYTIGFNLGNSLYSVSVGADWVLIDPNTSTAAGANAFDIQLRGAQTPTNSDTADILIWGAHVYRSDLGGMADIPTSYRGLSSSSTYLPTTSSARYLPRVDNHIWDGSSWVKRCLVEPQSTNLVTYSEDFTDPSWGKSGVTVSGNTLTATTATSNFIRKDPGYTSSTQYTAWAVVEDVNAGFAYITTFDGVDSFGAMFDLSDGSFVGYRTGTTNDNNWIQDLGGGKYLIGVTFTTGTVSASTFGFQVGLSTSGSLNFGSPTNGEQIIVHRAQAEASPVPTSYIPTTSSQVTRPADALSIDSTLLPYDSTAMTIAMDGGMTYANISAVNNVIFSLWEADSSNLLRSRLSTNGTTTTGQFQVSQAASGSADSIFGPTTSYSPGINVPFNIASRHTSSDLNGAVDGTALTANTTPTALPDLSATEFQIAPTGVVNIKSLRILGGYGATNAELEAATS